MTHPFAERIPESSEWRTVADSAFAAVEGFRRKASETRADRRFTAEGHREQLKQLAAQGPQQYFEQLRKNVESERQGLARRRSECELPTLKRDDLMGELKHQEIRTWLRSLPIGERIANAASDPAIAAAVVHAPPALSGLNDDGLARARSFLTDHLFGETLAAIDEEDAVLGNVEAALTIAQQQLDAEINPPSPKGNSNNG